ncbi:MAG TPA: cupin domain-containing protein [Rhizomicrobium sp.]|jgi:mannose-6-phosphate isomerase-like protein (cupin superfamily)|nr:cupin domain-containing protein [Rhizomicrobium sp.]
MSKTPLKIDLVAAASTLAASGQASVALFQHGDANLLLFVPTDQDTQQAHKRDEIYFVQAGHGIFKRGGETVRFDAGDVLFVPAGVPHRFASFSAEFKAWVIFFGPDGGVQSA